jgi:hypothetical protein
MYVGKKPDYLQRLESTWGLETPFKQLQAIQPRLRGGHKRSQATVGHARSPKPWQGTQHLARFFFSHQYRKLHTTFIRYYLRADTSVTSMVLESGESGERLVRHVFGADEPESEAEEWAFELLSWRASDSGSESDTCVVSESVRRGSFRIGIGLQGNFKVFKSCRVRKRWSNDVIFWLY